MQINSTFYVQVYVIFTLDFTKSHNALVKKVSLWPDDKYGQYKQLQAERDPYFHVCDEHVLKQPPGRLNPERVAIQTISPKPLMRMMAYTLYLKHNRGCQFVCNS